MNVSRWRPGSQREVHGRAGLHHGPCWIALLAMALLIACQMDDGAIGLASGTVDDAEIIVAAAEPDTVTVDTTVTVRITGSGFAEGDTASWLIDRTTAALEIRTLSTTYKSPTELEARIAVSPDAELREYSIRVRSKKGKQGIGVERFRVVAKPLALPEPGVRSAASDVNDRGVIVGYVGDASGPPLAVRWTPTDTGWSYTILGPGVAGAINNDGLIVRRDYDEAHREWHSWVHLASGATVHFARARVIDISNNGTLIGSVFDATLRATSVVWRQVAPASWGPPEPLPMLPGYTSTGVMDINSAGDIVGALYNSTTSAGVVWKYRDGQWQTPERIEQEILAGASAINDAGALVGWWYPCIPGVPTCYPSAAFWSSLGATRHTLPTLYGSGASVSEMNNANQIVGSAPVHYNDGSGPLAALVTHAVIWFPGSEWPEDLGAIRPSQPGAASAINNHGLIVGSVHSYPLRDHATAWQLPRTLMQLPRLRSRSR